MSTEPSDAFFRPAQPNEADYLRNMRTLHTARVLGWLLRDENAKVLRKMRHARDLFPAMHGQAPALALKRYLLQAISPINAKAGPEMEVHVFMVEAALHLIDWDYIVDYITNRGTRDAPTAAYQR